MKALNTDWIIYTYEVIYSDKTDKEVWLRAWKVMLFFNKTEQYNSLKR